MECSFWLPALLQEEVEGKFIIILPGAEGTPTSARLPSQGQGPVKESALPKPLSPALCLGVWHLPLYQLLLPHLASSVPQCPALPLKLTGLPCLPSGGDMFVFILKVL